MPRTDSTLTSPSGPACDRTHSAGAPGCWSSVRRGPPRAALGMAQTSSSDRTLSQPCRPRRLPGRWQDGASIGLAARVPAREGALLKPSAGARSFPTAGGCPLPLKAKMAMVVLSRVGENQQICALKGATPEPFQPPRWGRGPAAGPRGASRPLAWGSSDGRAVWSPVVTGGVAGGHRAGVCRSRKLAEGDAQSPAGSGSHCALS